MNRNKSVGFEGGIRVSTTKKEMHSEVPASKKWTKSLKSLRSFKEGYDKKKTEYYYSCTFKVPTDEKQLSEYIQSAEFAATLPFEERLNYEMSRTTICAYVRNKNFFIGDRIQDNHFPMKVRTIFAEMVKVKMLVEYEVYGNEEIRATIPSLDETKIDISVIQNEIEAMKSQIENEEVELDLDNILDKINTYGIGSITEKELEFLNNQSKRL